MQKIKINNHILLLFYNSVVRKNKNRSCHPLPRAELRSFNLPIKISKDEWKRIIPIKQLIQSKGKHPPKRIQKERVQGNLHAHSSVSACLV